MNSNSDKALIYLREQIINGHLAPQEKLVEQDLAEALGISRGPVRDALKQLAVEGLVTYEPNKGCTVALLSPKDAYELFFLRGNLEKLALQRSGGISDLGLLAMEAALNEFSLAQESGNTLLATVADEKFHRQIILSGQMERLTKMWELLSPMNSAMFLSIQNANRLFPEAEPAPGLPRRGDFYGAHKLLLDTIRSGNLQEACFQLDHHYEKTGERIYQHSLLQESET